MLNIKDKEIYNRFIYYDIFEFLFWNFYFFIEL